jgi:hypothetical protein
LVNHPSTLHWELPPNLVKSLRALREGGLARARIAQLPTSVAELKAAGKSPQLDSMMLALGV